MLLPTLAPTTTRPERRRRRAATADAPGLGKPIRLSSARSRSTRKTRGGGLPGCGWAVTVPTSTKPKPSRPSPSKQLASLSSPAATPSGLGKLRPSASTRSTGSRVASSRRSRTAQPGIRYAARSVAAASRCACSGASRRSTRSNSAAYSVTPPRPGRSRAPGGAPAGTAPAGGRTGGRRRSRARRTRRRRAWSGRGRRG